MRNRSDKKAEMAAWTAFSANRTPANEAEVARLINDGLTRGEVMARFGHSSKERTASSAAVPGEAEIDAMWKRRIDGINARLPRIG